MAILVRPDDLTGSQTRALIASHLDAMHAESPPESVHALDAAALADPAVTFWSAWDDDRLAGIAALKTLSDTDGEVKSMRVDDAYRGRGVGRLLVRHVIEAARARGMTRLWLETGSSALFEPARRLYLSEGFSSCGPFGDYTDDPLSVYFTLAL